MDDSSMAAWLATARAIHFASCMLMAGVWAFDRLIVRDEVLAWRRLALFMLLLATPVALLSGASWFVFVAASMGDVPVGSAIRNRELLATVWSQTRFGIAWQFHCAFWCAGAAMVGIWAKLRRGQWAGLIVCGGLVGGLTWAGHGDTGPARGWHLFCDFTHLLAVCIWPAGLVPLALLLFSMARSTAPARWIDIHRLVRRFSASSLLAVGLLTLTGLFNSWCLLGSAGALVTTTYGKILTVKLVLFAAMIGLGAVNLLVLKPRLSSSGDAALRRLRINVMIEIALGTGVVAAVGLLGLLEPPGPMNAVMSACCK